MEELLKKIAASGISLAARDNQLDIYDPNQVLTAELLADIKEQKKNLLVLLKDAPSVYTYTPIPKAAAKVHYPLSSAQRRLYFLYELDRTTTSYNIPHFISIKGPLDQARLCDAFNKLLIRHEILRTTFGITEQEPVQQVCDRANLEIEYFRATEVEAQKLARDFVQPFDLAKGPLVRVGLIQLADEEHILLVDMHHIISDALSQRIMVSDFMKLYGGETQSELALQYKDYAAWQQSSTQRAETAKHKAFWLKEFAQPLQALDLPTDFQRPLLNTYRGNTLQFDISAWETKALKTLADQQGCTLFMVILSVYNILLSKLTNQVDIVIGTSVEGRQHVDLEHMIGMFVNTLPLRNYPEGHLSYLEFLSSLKRRTLTSFDNQSYLYEQLIDEVKVDRNRGRNPLFDVMFDFHIEQAAGPVVSGLMLQPYGDGHATSKFDLTLKAMERDERLSFVFEYSAELFGEATIDRFIVYFKQIVSCILFNNQIKLSDIDVLTDQEKQQHFKINATATEIGEETVISLFRKWVVAAPDAVAITSEGQQVTYRELDVLSNRLANCLAVEHKGSAADLIGIELSRGKWFIVSILGVLKTGAAYLPVDPEYPAERKQVILGDAGIRLLISETSYLLNMDYYRGTVVAVDTELEGGQYAPDFPAYPLLPTDLAYVIYTSGSTGRPKGVMIEHGSLTNYCTWAADYYLEDKQERFALHTSISFDLTVTSIFPPLITGNEIVIYQDHSKGMLIEQVMNDQSASVIKLTPTHLRVIRDSRSFDSYTGERTIKLITGGENLEAQLAQDIRDKFNGKVEIYNEYGPTEATVGCMIYRYNPAETQSSVPIGRPIHNTQIYLLNAYGRPVPTGVSGEIYISGKGIARGYLNQKQLTEEKFPENSLFLGQRMYKTGDMARWQPDGNLEFLGRIDDQIKLRGFRIELGEIESRLMEHRTIKSAAVVAGEKDGDQFLAAYYESKEEIKIAELRNFLSDKLPHYMVPEYYTHLQKMPVTINGKLDRKALPEPEVKKSEDFVCPISKTQKSLATIWAEVLKVEADVIGLKANFFDLGGNSLKLVNLTNKINGRFNTQLSVADMFEFPTIWLLADYIDRDTDKKPNEEEGIYPAQISEMVNLFGYSDYD